MEEKSKLTQPQQPLPPALKQPTLIYDDLKDKLQKDLVRSVRDALEKERARLDSLLSEMVDIDEEDIREINEVTEVEKPFYQPIVLTDT